MDREKILALTPDELFEKYTVAEISQIKKIFIEEIKNIRDTLRTVINGKYEDFIEATGKVDKMKDNDISGRVQYIHKLYNVISNNKWFSNYDAYDPDENDKEESTYTAVILIKLLIDITEQTWCAIDDDDYISATLLVQLCSHIKTVLEVETNFNLKVSFPVVYEQWSVILQFPIILTNRIENTLLNTIITAEDCNKCLCSLMILENLSADDLLERLLQLRSKAIKRCFEKARDVKQNQSVKAYIADSLQIISRTLQLVYWGFFENSQDKEKCLRFYIQSVDVYTKAVFNLVSLDYTYTYSASYIPLIVKEFKVSLIYNSVQIDKIQRSVSDWLNLVKDCVSHEASELLNIISSMKLLKSVKSSCQAIPENWSIITESFELPYRFNLWQEFFELLMFNRVRIILSDNWNASFVLLKREIDALVLDMKNNKDADKELNLHSFMWQHDRDKNKNDGIRGDLSVKIEGVFPKSAYLCESMEKYVSSLMQDMTDVCDDQDDSEDGKIVALKEFQQHCCFYFIIRVVEYVSGNALSENASRADCVLMVKFLHGVPLLCPSIKKCLLSIVDNKNNKWIEIKNSLQENSDRIWKRCISFMLPNAIRTFKSELDLHDNIGLQIKIIPKWNTFTVDENNEDGDVVQSVVKVPCSVTFPLQHLLNELNVYCSQILPPKSVICELVLQAVREILQYYDECYQYSLPQVHYIQFMFDIMYLISLLIPVENKNALLKCQDTISKLESKIDPFDLDAISQYLMNNVKLCVNKTQAVYGLIAMNKTNTNVNLGSSSSSDDPNILNIPSQNISWFSLLPITASRNS